MRLDRSMWENKIVALHEFYHFLFLGRRIQNTYNLEMGDILKSLKEKSLTRKRLLAQAVSFVTL